jgi:hypothetical protein
MYNSASTHPVLLPKTVQGCVALESSLKLVSEHYDHFLASIKYFHHAAKIKEGKHGRSVEQEVDQLAYNHSRFSFCDDGS